MKEFTYVSKYGKYHECYFQVGSYENGNLAIEIWNNIEGPITRVTVNPDIKIPRTHIAVKDYSENEGMVEFLKMCGLIGHTPTNKIQSGYVTIPVYELTEFGKKLFV